MPAVFSNHLSFINFFSRIYKKTSAFLKFIDRIRNGSSGFHGYQASVLSLRNSSFHWLIFQESMGHYSFSGSSSQNLISKADDSTGRYDEFTNHTFAFIFHADHLPFSYGHHINGCTAHLFRKIYGHFFYRLTFYTVNFLNDNLWLPNLYFITFTTHGFNQY